MSERSILAVEMCLQYEARAHDYLRSLLVADAGPLSFHDKWQLYGRACACLRQNRGLWVSGCWDFFDEDLRARRDFNMWVQGMLTMEGARTTPSGSGDPYRDDPRYMTFTMACLMVQGSPSERKLNEVCRVPEGRLWHAQTFEHILSSMRHLNFASIEASTLYLIPKENEFALSRDDLKHPKFAYLRPIV